MNLNRNGLPKEWLFSNYIDAFVSISENQTSVLTMLWNSIWYTLGGTLLGVFVSSMTAYVAAKYVFPGRKNRLCGFRFRHDASDCRRDAFAV